MNQVTIHGTGNRDAITVEEAALNAQLVALHVYDPIISLLESLELLGKTKGKTGVDREIAEQGYKHNIARVRKMCGMEQPVPQPVQIPKRPTFGTKEGVTADQQAELFDKP